MYEAKFERDLWDLYLVVPRSVTFGEYLETARASMKPKPCTSTKTTEDIVAQTLAIAGVVDFEEVSGT